MGEILMGHERPSLSPPLNRSVGQIWPDRHLSRLIFEGLIENETRFWLKPGTRSKICHRRNWLAVIGARRSPEANGPVLTVRIGSRHRMTRWCIHRQRTQVVVGLPLHRTWNALIKAEDWNSLDRTVLGLCWPANFTYRAPTLPSLLLFHCFLFHSPPLSQRSCTDFELLIRNSTWACNKWASTMSSAVGVFSFPCCFIERRRSNV